LSKKFLCQFELLTTQISHPQKPPTRAGLGGVTRIAGCRLLSLRQENLFVSNEQGPEALVLVRQWAKLLYGHDRSNACEPNDSPVERNSAIEGGPGSYYPVPADCSRFNHIPIAELDDERDDSRVGKVNVTDLIASFSQHIAITELNELQIRLNGAKDSTRKRCEQSIG